MSPGRRAADIAAEPSPADLLPRVLVVDDHPDSREILSEAFLAYRFHVETAADGMEAVAKAGQASPDAVIVDLSLPQLDGFEVTRRLRADETRPPPVIVAFTAFSDSATHDRARAAGCAAVITKPATPQAVLETLLPLLGESGAAATGDAAVDRRRAALSGCYRALLPSRARALAVAWREARQEEAAAVADLQTMHEALDRLMAAALACGLPRVGDCAARVQMALARYAQNPRRRDRRSRVDRWLERLEAVAAEVAAGGAPSRA